MIGLTFWFGLSQAGILEPVILNFDIVTKCGMSVNSNLHVPIIVSCVIVKLIFQKFQKGHISGRLSSMSLQQFYKLIEAFIRSQLKQ